MHMRCDLFVNFRNRVLFEHLVNLRVVIMELVWHVKRVDLLRETGLVDVMLEGLVVLTESVVKQTN